MLDPEMRELVRRQGAGKSIEQMCALIREAFPERRAPSVSTVSLWLLKEHGCARTRRPPAARPARRKPGRKSKLMRDAELATFAEKHLKGCTIDQVRALCLERFGAARVPSRSAFARFTRLLRGSAPRDGRQLNGDAELRDFVRKHSYGRTIKQVRALCVERFGAARVPSRSALGRYTMKLPGEKLHGRRKLGGDAELLAFVQERRGRMTLDELRAACIVAFPGRAIPSRSALGRVRIQGGNDA